MGFQGSSLITCQSSLAILAALVLGYRVEKQTNRHTRPLKTTHPATSVDVANNNINQEVIIISQ